MAIVRLKKRDHFVSIDTRILRDSRLSWAARGLAAHLLTNADSWQISVRALMKQATGRGTGRDSVRKLLNELGKAGYLERGDLRTQGSFRRCDYVLYEESSEIRAQAW